MSVAFGCTSSALSVGGRQAVPSGPKARLSGGGTQPSPGPELWHRLLPGSSLPLLGNLWRYVPSVRNGSTPGRLCLGGDPFDDQSFLPRSPRLVSAALVERFRPCTTLDAGAARSGIFAVGLITSVQPAL